MPTGTPTVTPVITPGNELRFFTLAPCRVVDTRGPSGPFGGPALAAGSPRTFDIGGQCGIPPDAKAVALNLTVTGAAVPGHLTIYPGGEPLPLASTINYGAGQTRANNAVLRLGAGGTATATCSQAEGSVNLIIDTTGYFQ